MADVKELMQIVSDVQEGNQKLTTEQTEHLKQLSDEFMAMPLDGDISKPLISLLSLSDDEFKTIAPLILLDFNKNMHNSNNQLLIAQTCNARGIGVEDLIQEFDGIKEELDKVELSKPKKDFIAQMIMDMVNAFSEIQGIPKRVIEVPIELCHEDAKIPCYANPTDSGMDIYALEDITIAPGETVIVPTGLKVAIPVGYELQVRPKSGRCVKTKLRIANTPGTIDAGYRDEIGVIIDNIDAPIKKLYMNDNGTIAGIDHGSSYTIGKGEKFAQLVLCQITHCSFQEIDSVMTIENDGRAGGFGSTGLK